MSANLVFKSQYNKCLFNHSKLLVQLSLAVVTVTEESNSARKTSGLSIATSNPATTKKKRLTLGDL